MTPENPAGLREVTLDDPRLPDLRSRIHAARGHDWQPPCGSCLDWAFDYLRAADALDATEPGLDEERRCYCASFDEAVCPCWHHDHHFVAARLREEGEG